MTTTTTDVVTQSIYCNNNNNNNNNKCNNTANQKSEINCKSNTHTNERFALAINKIIFSPPLGATLVEEEDFNELTAVPTTTIVIANNVRGGSSTKLIRQLPPPKRNGKANGVAKRHGGAIAATLRNVLQRQSATTFNAASGKQPANISAPPSEETQATNELTPLVEHQSNSRENLVKTSASPYVTNTTTTYQATNTTTAAAAAAAAATVATTTTYSHNSKTTRYWPVIYRNPHHYDYEALHAQSQAANNLIQSPYVPPASSASFRQNCYSNQFQQSIVYSSSNEDLTTINECVANGGDEDSSGGGGSGGGSADGLFDPNGRGSSSSGRNNHRQQQQTTCYYFASSRHNSIYEQPPTILGNSTLHFDPTNAATVESLRHNNNILLRNSSCSSKIMQQTATSGCSGTVDVSNSITAISGGIQGDTTTCCANCCMGPPPVLFLFVTLLMTTSATAMLCAAIMTDHWEHVTWDRESLDKYTNRSGLRLDWIMDEKIAMLKPYKRVDYRFRRDTLFLVPMHGGIWTLCIDLPLRELQELRRHPKFPPSAPTCLNYLAGSSENARGEEQRNDWQHSESQRSLQPHLRMQNLSISCSLVCLIILGSAALVGAFGVCQRQISAILITGVMYLLAALFALFTLMIIHFKRQQGRPMLDSDYDGTVDGIVARPGGAAILAKPLLGARVFLTSWSLDLGWGGVALCAITSVLWILLSKIMRYNPFSTLMI